MRFHISCSSSDLCSKVGGRSASRSAKFGVMVFKASMLDRWGRSASRSAKFGVTVFKASMLNCWWEEVDLPVDLQSLV